MYVRTLVHIPSHQAACKGVYMCERVLLFVCVCVSMYVSVSRLHYPQELNFQLSVLLLKPKSHFFKKGFTNQALFQGTCH